MEKNFKNGIAGEFRNHLKNTESQRNFQMVLCALLTTVTAVRTLTVLTAVAMIMAVSLSNPVFAEDDVSCKAELWAR